MRAGQLPVDEQLAHLRTALREKHTLMEVLGRATAMNLPGWYLVTGQPAEAGILDYDLAYFDDSDLSWEAEHTVIRAGSGSSPGCRPGADPQPGPRSPVVRAEVGALTPGIRAGAASRPAPGSSCWLALGRP